MGEKIRTMPCLDSLGDSHVDLNRHTDSVDAYRQALRIDPDGADTWSHLGAIYFFLGNQAGAFEALSTLR